VTAARIVPGSAPITARCRQWLGALVAPALMVLGAAAVRASASGGVVAGHCMQ
jgi:hypothetical protein